MDFGVRPISRPKIENFTIKKHLFPILYTPAKFQASSFNNKKKVLTLAEPLTNSAPCYRVPADASTRHSIVDVMPF